MPCERPQRGKFTQVLKIHFLWTPKILVSNQLLSSSLGEVSEDKRTIKKPLAFITGFGKTGCRRSNYNETTMTITMVNGGRNLGLGAQCWIFLTVSSDKGPTDARLLSRVWPENRLLTVSCFKEHSWSELTFHYWYPGLFF